MKSESLAIRDVLLIEPRVFGDERGFVFESYNKRVLDGTLGRTVTFVQDNHSRSGRNVVRGLHYQVSRPQAKLVRTIAGEVFDVAVDLRRSSATFGRHVAVRLSADNRRELWIPEGFAHGYAVMSEYAEVVYKMTDYWMPEHERCIAWDDPALAIAWPLTGTPTLSARDSRGTSFAAAETYA